MIGYIRGRIIGQEGDHILLLSGDLGYEILLDPVTLSRVCSQADDDISLYIYYHVTERQPKPVLIGFLDSQDKDFFQLFITVAAIGPMKAVKALTQPVPLVARAIEDKDTAFLSELAGIGKRTAEKIVATLNGKVLNFTGPEAVAVPDQAYGTEDSRIVPQVIDQVADVLTEQLGHSAASAKRMIKEALDRNPGIITPEDLFDEIYREDR
jgi:Holliday junction DNA helicase RuvA